MPTAILSPCSEPGREDTRVPARLPRGRVWVPAGDFPAALRALELLRSAPPLEDGEPPPGVDSV